MRSDRLRPIRPARIIGPAQLKSLGPYDATPVTLWPGTNGKREEPRGDKSKQRRAARRETSGSGGEEEGEPRRHGSVLVVIVCGPVGGGGHGQDQGPLRAAIRGGAPRGENPSLPFSDPSFFLSTCLCASAVEFSRVGFDSRRISGLFLVD